MKMREMDRPKRAFVRYAGVFPYTQMTFGLTSAPACFLRALDINLTKYKCNICLVYLEDLIISSPHLDEHFRHVDKS